MSRASDDACCDYFEYFEIEHERCMCETGVAAHGTRVIFGV